jgi:predicted transcriptional regulator of viral defense system
MSTASSSVVNENFKPDKMEEQVLEHLKAGREAGTPWGYTSASIAAEALGTRRQYTSSALGSLHDAGWVEKVEPEGTGVYRFIDDPREEDNEHDS